MRCYLERVCVVIASLNFAEGRVCGCLYQQRLILGGSYMHLACLNFLWL